jgi:benzoyl-CoA reductase subunit D
MITVGIDCGAKNTKTVVMKNGTIIGKGLVLTGLDQHRAIQLALDAAYQNAGISGKDVTKFGGTGSGKKAVSEGLKVDDIKAIGRGANFFFPEARTVADVGAEEGRAAKLDEKGNALDFAVNEKCAAGAGVFIETMSRALDIPLADMGLLALKSDKEIPMNAQCVVFAESEVVGLIHANAEKKDISRAIHNAMASHVVSMIRRIGVNPEVVMLGGVAYNPGFVAAMKRQLAVEKLLIPENPEFGAAVGAALIAAEES